MRTRERRRRGFTLIEVLLASVLSSLLIIAAFGILYDSIGIADVLKSRTDLNAAARESFDLVLDGGISGPDTIFGVRGLNLAELNASSLRNGYRVQLTNNGAATPLYGPSVVSRNITCKAAADPIPACVGTETLTVDGYLGGDPTITTSRSIQGGGGDRTREIQLFLDNPYLLSRDDTTTEQSTEVYRTIFMLDRD